MSKHARSKTLCDLEKLSSQEFSTGIYMLKDAEGGTWIPVDQLRDFVKACAEEEFFTVIKNSPLILDHYKDPVTGLYVQFRQFKVEVVSFEEKYSKGVFFRFKFWTPNLNYRAINHDRRYSSLIRQRHERFREIFSRVGDALWIQGHFVAKNTTV